MVLKLNINNKAVSKYCFSLFVLLFQINFISGQETIIHYEGSSTIAHFIRDAEQVYGKTRFDINTETESSGGELAILEGVADIGGVARIPSPKILGKGVVSTLIGWDAIALIVNSEIPVDNLTKEQLKGIFTNQITNWNSLGGPDLTIMPFIVEEQSATRKVFRSSILKEEDYVNCQTVSIDRNIINKVAETPGAIGQISLSFLEDRITGVKDLSIDGQRATVDNQSYPITRPLYLLWWPGRKAVSDFIDWTQSQEAQDIIKKRFIAKAQSNTEKFGKLIVYTRTNAVEDAGTYYYPHEPYDIFNSDNVLIRSISNHLDPIDENPTIVNLPAGNYLIWTTTAKVNNGEKLLVSIESGKTTRVNVDDQQIVKAVAQEQIDDSNRKLQFTGDFRFRVEQDWNSYRKDGSLRNDRGRLRYRLRLGFNYKHNEVVTIGARLRTSTRNNLQSPHITLGQNDNHSMSIDKAFVKINKNKYSFWLGKNTFPFWKQNELYWSDNIAPEGAAFDGNISLNNNVKVKYSIGYFIINSLGQQLSNDSSLRAFQLKLEKQSSKFNLITSLGIFDFRKIEDKNILEEVHKLDYQLLIAGMSVKYDFKSPVAIGFDYIRNLSNYDQDLLITSNNLQNEKFAWVANLKIGSISKTGDVMFAYYYSYIQKYAVIDFLAQDDWVRWDLGNNSGTRSSNFKGHEFRLAYALRSDMNIVLRSYFVKEIIKELPSQAELETSNRIRLDFNLKF